MKDKQEGMTVQEIENFGKKFGFEITFLVFFILASFFTFVFFGPKWSIYLAGLGGIIGVFLPLKIEKCMQNAFRCIFKQEKLTQIILVVVGVIISLCLPALIFFILGLAGGSGFHKYATKLSE